MTQMIQVEDLTKYFDAFCAVDHISLTIKRGEIVGLLGPNGAGKTTTLRILTGYLTPTSGHIRVKDRTIDQNALEIRKAIGYLPEFAPLYPNMLVYDYLNFIADIRGIKDGRKMARIRHMADICGLRAIMSKNIGELSRGLKQRVGLAHAMIGDPEILILDEPTSGLDPNQRLEIKNIIREIGKEKTVILSTHILSEAEATCDRIVIIHKGKIVADDSTRNLKQSANQKHVIHLSLLGADLKAAQNTLNNIQGIENISQLDADAGKDALHLRIDCSPAEDLRAALYAVIKKTDWIIIELHQEAQGLETVFRNLTKEQ